MDVEINFEELRRNLARADLRDYSRIECRGKEHLVLLCPEDSADPLGQVPAFYLSVNTLWSCHRDKSRLCGAKLSAGFVTAEIVCDFASLVAAHR